MQSLVIQPEDNGEACLASKQTYRSFATTVSQLKICDFSGETFKGFEVL